METVRRVAAMLDLSEPQIAKGDPVPLGWHFPLLGARTAARDLRPDRFPGLGINLPRIALPRLVATGRSITFHTPIALEVPLLRSSIVESLVHKETPSGKIATLATRHQIQAADAATPAIEERQTYIFLSSGYETRIAQPWQGSANARTLGAFAPSDTLLFQFSALSFNSHRIHLDRDYTRDVEGYPDLVVNGGITTLLMTEYARNAFGFLAGRIKVSNKAPLFVDRPITFIAEDTATGQKILALDDNGALAAEMELEQDDL
jgi:3-methylfumaryl-CoA hydratase